MAFSVAVPTNDEVAEANITKQYLNDPGARYMLLVLVVVLVLLALMLLLLTLSHRRQPDRHVRLDRRRHQGRGEPRFLLWIP